jgi:hypothetical protein
MALTDKDKRLITSPSSLPTEQRKTVKFRLAKKIKTILSDSEFLMQNKSNLTHLGIDIDSNYIIPDLPKPETVIKDKLPDDSDLL